VKMTDYRLGGRRGTGVEAATECEYSSEPGGEPVDSAGALVVVIPAYRPGRALIDLVKTLSATAGHTIVVVDDGSGPESEAIFAEVRQIGNVQVIPHAINMGKGAALKTAINLSLCVYQDAIGVVTVDADGQHDPADVLRVCKRFQAEPDALVLGVRDFCGAVPARSRIGNAITRRALRVVVGQNVADSQTGLRAIPTFLLPMLLKVGSPGYEFELDMLIAAKHLGVRVIEQPIRTIYQDGNRSSHFQPVRDSMRIYFVLLRFTFISVLTAILDNAVFFLCFRVTRSILLAQAVARLASILFNYNVARRAVFHSDGRHSVLFPRYVALVIVNATISYAGIRLLIRVSPLGVFPAKILIESLLFIANFAIQRDFVFTRRMRMPRKLAPPSAPR